MIGDRDAGTVLVVAADATARATLGTWLELAAYRPLTVGTAHEALARMRQGRQRPAALVIELGEEAGVDALRHARAIDPSIGAVLLGDAPAALLEGLGASPTVLSRGCDRPELLTAIAGEIRRRIERATAGQWRQVVEEVLEERSQVFERRLEQFAAASLEVLVTSLEARDPFMAGHSVRVAQLSASLADSLGHTPNEVELVRLAGRLHDVGMMVISDRIVNRDGPLTAEEYDQVRQHPLVGYQLLQPYPHLSEVARFVRGHHERWDGAGYPDGIAGPDIPWGGRIIAVVEVYDALVTRRAYRSEVMTPHEAEAEVHALAGTALDPEVCAALRRVIGRRRTLEFVLDPAWRETAALAAGAS